VGDGGIWLYWRRERGDRLIRLIRLSSWPFSVTLTYLGLPGREVPSELRISTKRKCRDPAPGSKKFGKG
jgi:hypothetical protein